jgi:hypothetical protein
MGKQQMPLRGKTFPMLDASQRAADTVFCSAHRDIYFHHRLRPHMHLSKSVMNSFASKPLLHKRYKFLTLCV